MDWAVLQQAGRGTDWDYGPDGDAEKAVCQHLNNNRAWMPRAFIALALDMDQRKLEKLLYRLATKGDLQVRNHKGHVQWRAS
jgi:hypothetical protein